MAKSSYLSNIKYILQWSDRCKLGRFAGVSPRRAPRTAGVLHQLSALSARLPLSRTLRAPWRPFINDTFKARTYGINTTTPPLLTSILIWINIMSVGSGFPASPHIVYQPLMRLKLSPCSFESSIVNKWRKTIISIAVDHLARGLLVIERNVWLQCTFPITHDLMMRAFNNKVMVYMTLMWMNC